MPRPGGHQRRDVAVSRGVVAPAPERGVLESELGVDHHQGGSREVIGHHHQLFRREVSTVVMSSSSRSARRCGNSALSRWEASGHGSTVALGSSRATCGRCTGVVHAASAADQRKHGDTDPTELFHGRHGRHRLAYAEPAERSRGQPGLGPVGPARRGARDPAEQAAAQRLRRCRDRADQASRDEARTQACERRRRVEHGERPQRFGMVDRHVQGHPAAQARAHQVDRPRPELAQCLGDPSGLVVGASQWPSLGACSGFAQAVQAVDGARRRQGRQVRPPHRSRRVASRQQHERSPGSGTEPVAPDPAERGVQVQTFLHRGQQREGVAVCGTEPFEPGPVPEVAQRAAPGAAETGAGEVER